ncbi:RNA 2'-phosphotransferase [Salibacterium qingdaonense]|uniref:Probable RNA 2'-phosphotransferase n=1 Tax=Salibacterium qingdaonense TaxID=266892 RepID=A0A1I4N2M2_9BACI|nr:RNA 2'-phosphotransferase [Salibacterium qingdaonense]SFM09824.1 putative RNA 2'-phosphotransferase [Salibacterium qingdaonense]
MQQKEKKRYSKVLSLMLRHEPEAFGITLDHQGFTPLEDVVHALRRKGSFPHATKEEIHTIAADSDKQRFEIVSGHIRARYGHSVNVEPHDKETPPPYLLHGTHVEALPAIRREGINRRNRRYVHLSEHEDFAQLAGQRRGQAVLLTIDTTAAEKAGVAFFRAGSGVWLSTNIPPHCVVEEKRV